MRARKDSCETAAPLSGQKTKLQTSSSASRLIPKKIWKSRSKSSSRNNSSIIPQWISQGHCRWLSSTGRWYNLCDTNLLELTDMERTALKQIAIARLQSFKLGCKIESPKEHSASDKKRRPYMLKKKALTTGMFDRKDKRNQEIASGLVFGTSLERCLENDRTIRQKNRCDEGVGGKARSKSTTTTKHASLLGKTLASTASCHSLSDILNHEDDIKTQSLLNSGCSESNESLDMEKRNRLFGKCDSIPDLDCPSSSLWNKGPSVPSIVHSCFHHLQTYGLNTVGIFRVSSSKRRVRQLRDDFDSGKHVQLNEQNHPHDVAQLLKEYFRDLKEPLLSKELYSAFIATKRLKNKIEQREALQYLVCMLPVANRDTLWSLLNFLNDVAAHSEDTNNASGQTVPGNKMDSYNLATVFGPNILRCYRSGSDKEYKVESAMRADERSDVTRVMQTLIDHHTSIFTVSADLLDHVFLHIQHKDPQSLNSLLCVKSNLSDYEAENEPFSGLKMSSRRFSDSVETITKDDSSEINSPLGSSSSFNEIIFMDADEVKNGYPTRRGHSASHLPTLSQDKNRLKANVHMSQLDQRRRSSDDVNQVAAAESSSNMLSDCAGNKQALSVPDMSFRRLSSPEINMVLPGITPISLNNSSQPKSPPVSSAGSPDKPLARVSPEEVTKPILKSPTEHFKVFVTDDTSGTERLAGEFQTVKFTTNLVESTWIHRTQRPQICHLLTMPQPAIMRLPKFTTIEEDATSSNEKSESPTNGVEEVKVDPAPPPAKSGSKLQGILKTLKSSSGGSDKSKQEEQSPTTTKKSADQSTSATAAVKASTVAKKNVDQSMPATTAAKAPTPTATKKNVDQSTPALTAAKAPTAAKKNVDQSTPAPTAAKAPEAPVPRRRFRPKTEEGGSPTRTRKDFLRRRRVRDKNPTKPVVATEIVPKVSKDTAFSTGNEASDKKPDQWKRCEIISSEHMETYV